MDPVGTHTLRPRRWLVWAAGPVAVLFAAGVALAWSAWRAGELPGPAALALGALCGGLAVVSVEGAARIPRTRFVVTPETVRHERRGRVVLELRHDRLTRVLPYVGGVRRWPFPATWTHAVRLSGTDASGHERSMTVRGSLLPTLVPLLAALRPALAARPQLLPDERARRLFEEYAAG